MQHSGDTDQVYLDASQARQFRDELANLPASVSDCAATKACVYGIARCRPSQDVKQALCPSTYQTRKGEHGIALATPRTALRFPDADAQEFVDALQSAISMLADRDAGR